MADLTDRQRREVEYHKEHSLLVETSTIVNFNVITSRKRRWWNAYWDLWTFLLTCELRGKNVLVVGCGAGGDALMFAECGSAVAAFDLSPDMIALAREAAGKAGLAVEFSVMPSERLNYPDSSFDIVFARDILHHVEIPATMKEIARVAKPGALLVVDEIYSHSVTELVRRSRVVERVLYPAMRSLIYRGQKPYVTQDERKMNERDIAQVKAFVGEVAYRKYFNFFVTRIIPDRFRLLNQLDRLSLVVLGPLGYFVAGRIALVGRVQKPA
jgi:ubiquinone/menaquinone biosynthesis C-methylase UbiE